MAYRWIRTVLLAVFALLGATLLQGQSVPVPTELVHRAMDQVLVEMDNPFLRVIKQGSWITNGLKWLYATYPRVVGYIYFDIHVIGGEGGVNWRLDTTPSALTAWRAATKDPRYMGTAFTSLGLTIPAVAAK